MLEVFAGNPAYWKNEDNNKSKSKLTQPNTPAPNAKENHATQSQKHSGTTVPRH